MYMGISCSNSVAATVLELDIVTGVPTAIPSTFGISAARTFIFIDGLWVCPVGFLVQELETYFGT